MHVKMFSRSFLPLVVQVLVLVLVCSATSDIRYVRPADSPPSSCPGEPCLTLHEYVEIDNFTNGTTLQFIPGNHTLQGSLRLENISNITFETAFNHSVTNILCNDSVFISFGMITHLHIVGLTFILSQRGGGSALLFRSCKSIFISDTVFQRSGKVMITGRAMQVINSEATIIKCVFKGLIVADRRRGGGAIHSNGSSLTILQSSFTRNAAYYLGGGALYLIDTNLTTERSHFINNVVGFNGGAIFSSSSALIIHQCFFAHNVAHRSGGAIFSITGDIEEAFDFNNVDEVIAYKSHLELNRITFNVNSASEYGGAITCSKSQVKMLGIVFHNNSCPSYGGAVTFILSQLNIVTANFSFNNGGIGGGICLFLTDTYFGGRVTMLNNTAVGKGGALMITNGPSKEFVSFDNLQLIGNTAGNDGGAMYVSDSNATLHGNVTIEGNTANTGGGIRADRSHVHLMGDCSLAKNKATYGGAMNSFYGTVSLQGPTSFAHNTADKDGGAVYAIGTVIQILENVEFTFNLANNGGGMFFDNGASLYFSDHLIGTDPLLSSSFNYARQDGGVIYHRDSPSITQCSCSNRLESLDENCQNKLPNCFFHLSLNYHDIPIVSANDSAVREGNFIFGGLTDRCKIENGHTGRSWLDSKTIAIYGNPNSRATKREISSKPYSLCLCSTDCSPSAVFMQVEVYRGQKFTVPLLAEMQYGATATIVTAITSSTARLETYQTSQPLPDYCTPLSYTVYSNDTHEQVVLYPDGPCRDTGLARVVIDVTLLPCPDGFTQSGEICTCEDRLHDYPVNCTIADTPYLTKTPGLDFWIGASYVNTTYQGLVLGRSCPAEYCKKGAVNVTIDNPDMQCDLNRTGLLCGACAANHSLMLGGPQCQVCPNTYLALLLPFAAAGVALVVFLTCLRLTVATGTLNSIILYANILQVKRSLFFPQDTRNLLTVFLAWMNLDLGFQTCFYEELDAYALTWLQFAFPVYVWFIIGLIIFISRYSITVSKLIGSNPIAVLATLLLMSYTKILKIIIEVYSYDKLDYPDSKTDVWLKDANVPYLESRHLFLTVVTSLVLVFLFLPYTLLLLLGYKLYRFTGKKHWHWLNRLKPLLDSYYAPYKNHTRYWTGFLLLVRCALYLVFSLSSGSKSIIAISLIFTAIGFVIGYIYLGRIYKNTLVNLIQAGVYLNLIVLSVTAVTGLNTAALVYSLVGLVFLVMIALIAHQFHLLYIAKTALWLWLKNKWPEFRKEQPEEQITPPNTVNPSHDPHKLVTKSVIELREPLLEV